MPFVNWTNLPRAVREHLYVRARSRELTKVELSLLMEWVLSNPAVPDGQWCKDFGSFKLAGEGALPKTFSHERPSVYWNADLISNLPILDMNGRFVMRG
jgi:hypothetical protein